MYNYIYFWYWDWLRILVRYMILILNCISASSLFLFSLKKHNQCSLSMIYSFCRQFICQQWSVKVLYWYHWIGLEKDINRYRFFIFYFWSGIFDKSSKFWAASCKNESDLLLVWITVCMCSNRNLFRRTVLQNVGETSTVSWITAWEEIIPTSHNLNQNRTALWWIFSSNKSAAAKRKTWCYANCDPNKQGVGLIFCMKWLRILNSFLIFKSEI